MKYIHLLVLLFVLTACLNKTNKPEKKNGTIRPTTIQKNQENPKEIAPNDSLSSEASLDKQTDSLDFQLSYMNDSEFETPASSSDGKYILVQFHNYSCCYDDGQFFRLYNQNEEVWTVQTYPAEDIEWSDATYDSVNIRLDRLLKTRSYFKMHPIHSYKIDTLESISGPSLSIKFHLNRIYYKSESFKIDPIDYENSRCCLGGYEDENYVCEIIPDIRAIWMDSHFKTMLLEYGILNNLEGCDRGPFFKTVAIATGP